MTQRPNETLHGEHFRNLTDKEVADLRSEHEKWLDQQGPRVQQAWGREPRRCYWLDETCASPDGTGFIPSIVVEGEPGHTPLKGDPAKFQTPWIWGPTIEDAKRQVGEANAKLGIDEGAALEIVLSSMTAAERPAWSG